MRVMPYLFIFLYITASQLTYIIALHQQMGFCTHPWATTFCLFNRVIIAVTCIWYCGWICGIVLVAFSLFGLVHATIGWILTLPSSLTYSERTLIKATDFECGLLIPYNIICLAFTVLSFFLSYYKSALALFPTINHLLIVVAILAAGFIIRIIVQKHV